MLQISREFHNTKGVQFLECLLGIPMCKSISENFSEKYRVHFRAESTNHNEEVKDSVEGVDGVEDIVGTDAVLEVVDQEKNTAFQVNVEDDDQVELPHFRECQQIPAMPAKK